MLTTPASNADLSATPLLSATPSIVVVPPDCPASSSTETPGNHAAVDIAALHVVNGEHFSGAERVQSHLGRCLPSMGIRADFAMVKPDRFARELDEQEGAWGTGYRVPMRRRVDLGPIFRIRSLVRSQGYQLLHAHTPRTAMITAVAARLAGIPWVYHVHSPATRDSTRWMVNHINAVIESQSLRRCDGVITVSRSLRQDCITRGINPDRITVVPNGVPSIAPQRKATPPRVDDPNYSWTIGMVALMRARKGLEVALEALAVLRDAPERDHSRPMPTLRIIGPFETESYRQWIAGKIAELKIELHVEFVGFTNDVPGELAAMDAMVLPSLFGEGMPMVVLESMAAGTPVIATRVEGTPEAVTHDVEGLLAEPADASSLAQQIGRLIYGQIDWHAMSAAAQRRHAADFSDYAMARGVGEVYRNLLMQA